jgi:hypothetical protein
MTIEGKHAPGKAPHELLPGEYAKWNAGGYSPPPPAGNWYAVPPGTDLVANLSSHQIIEHEDGTITVAPSILVRNHKESWHGFLKHGQWESA